MTVVTDAEPCDVCGDAGPMHPVVTMSLCGVLDAEIRGCPKCGFRQVRPRLAPGELATLYPDAYFDPEGEIGYSAYARERQRAEREAYFLADTVRRLGPSARVLEVGSALGFLLEALRRFAGCEVQGVDVSAFAARFADSEFGVPVRVGTLEEARFPDARFDLILQKDLLEHVLRPREHLVETFRVLAPGGLVWLVTPNGETNVRPLVRRAREERAAGSGLLPMMDQGHLSFFTRGNLESLFRETGFEIVSLRTVHLKRGLRALGYLPRRRDREKVAPGGRARGGAVTGGEESAVANGDALVRKLSAALQSSRRDHRSAPWYFHVRRLTGVLDRTPPGVDAGLDFECWLRKPR
jgi:2-polyprenyl-3-methyl-5-hydroxy-6-metoxy-1,4-benzoquinol methylase